MCWAFAVLVDPQVRVQACGFTGAGDAEKVRVYAAVRGEHAVVARQDPGPDHDCGGAVHVARMASGRCGQAVVAALPGVDAGRAPRIEVDRLDLETGPDADDTLLVFEPLGIVFAVEPWNVPYFQVVRPLAPQLMAGNAVVLKHASDHDRAVRELRLR